MGLRPVRPTQALRGCLFWENRKNRFFHYLDRFLLPFYYILYRAALAHRFIKFQLSTKTQNILTYSWPLRVCGHNHIFFHSSSIFRLFYRLLSSIYFFFIPIQFECLMRLRVVSDHFVFDGDRVPNPSTSARRHHLDHNEGSRSIALIPF